MLYLFLWETYFRKNHIHKWKMVFAQKHSEFNIFHINDPISYWPDFFYQNLIGNGLFSEKKLIILDNFPFLPWPKEDTEVYKTIEKVFLELLPSISQDTTFVFNNEKADKRSALYKLITTHGEIKDYSIVGEDALRAKLLSEYSNKLSSAALSRLIALKGPHFGLVQQELDKLFLTRSFVDIVDLEHIAPELEENIFSIIDDILALNIYQSIHSIRETFQLFDNAYSFYNMLMAQLRVYFYIFLLQYQSISSSEITQLMNLWKRSFLIGRKTKISKEAFFVLYQNLASLDAKMKQWKLLGNEWEDFLYEIEKMLLIS